MHSHWHRTGDFRIIINGGGKPIFLLGMKRAAVMTKSYSCTKRKHAQTTDEAWIDDSYQGQRIERSAVFSSAHKLSVLWLCLLNLHMGW
jgi:hypothetical protein